MEKTKSLLLFLLVVSSLMQSYFLAYSTPNLDLINPTDYVQSELNGTQKGLADVLYPEQIILHFGKKKHTLLQLNQQFYQMIYMDLLKRRTFDGLRRTSLSGLNLNWETIRNDLPGFEVRFKAGIPLHTLQSIMQIKEDLPLENDSINRIWIYVKENKEEVRTFFFSDTNSVVYEVVKADLSVKDVEKYVGLGQFLTSYHTQYGAYYLPDQPLLMPRIRLAYTQFTPDQLKRSLFVDPNMTRFLLERDGTEIYTDSKRGLQLKNEQRWLSYTDPISAPLENKNDIKENLLSAIQFINQHGGWNSSYVYSKVSPKQGFGAQTIVFRQYMDNYPIVNPDSSYFGFIKLVLQKGVVSSYERSLVNMDSKSAIRSEASLVGGKELDQLVNSYGKKADIVSVFPAYQAVFSADLLVELIPRWTVELRDGSYEYLDAR